MTFKHVQTQSSTQTPERQKHIHSNETCPFYFFKATTIASYCFKCGVFLHRCGVCFQPVSVWQTIKWFETWIVTYTHVADHQNEGAVVWFCPGCGTADQLYSLSRALRLTHSAHLCSFWTLDLVHKLYGQDFWCRRPPFWWPQGQICQNRESRFLPHLWSGSVGGDQKIKRQEQMLFISSAGCMDSPSEPAWAARSSSREADY